MFSKTYQDNLKSFSLKRICHRTEKSPNGVFIYWYIVYFMQKLHIICHGAQKTNVTHTANLKVPMSLQLHSHDIDPEV